LQGERQGGILFMIDHLKRFRRLGRRIITLARVIYWIKDRNNCLVVFTWHQITPGFSQINQHRYTWTSLDLFKKNLDFISSHFTMMNLNDAITLLEEGKLKGKIAALTFDDGDASLHSYILPVLKKKGLPATFFVNTAYLETASTYWFPILSYLSNSNEAYIEWSPELSEQASKLRTTTDPAFYNSVRERVESLAYLVPDLNSRLVSTGWLSRLDNQQFAIGAHGHEHQRYSMMPIEWQANDLTKNVRLLSDFSSFKPVFAIPFGRPIDWTQATLRIANAAKLKVVSSTGGLNFAPQEHSNRLPADGRNLAEAVVAEIRQHQNS
jgi:peptidoglycan/xylan/chitin deacetylase (PgdA/CDA1 family)